MFPFAISRTWVGGKSPQTIVEIYRQPNIEAQRDALADRLPLKCAKTG